jgi:cyclophilin family peptidyl-prolyl cis-trans isomerase
MDLLIKNSQCTMKKIAFILTFLSITVLAAAQVKKVPVKSKPVVKKPNIVKIIPAKTPVVVKHRIPGVRIKITTDSGVIMVRLSDSTPLHRDNFVKLVKQGFYDSLIFHRIISQFMIQGGDPESKNAAAGAMLGNGGGDMQRIPAEIKPSLYHKRGVLAAARDGNPEKASSACQFYIVQGKKFTDQELDIAETRIGRKYSITERMVYKSIGGTPWLDGNYTVFGEVESGIEVVDKIASVPKDGNDRPLGDIRMKMEIISSK